MQRQQIITLANFDAEIPRSGETGEILSIRLVKLLGNDQLRGITADDRIP
jgi:hypothetical protein